jgi:cell fate (sporulation/competence/biofilm development) regulator YlbF (YheA/YmcA/DUF963 family)
MCKSEIKELQKDFQTFKQLQTEFEKFRSNDFLHLEEKVDAIKKKVDSRTALYAFITSIITLITLLVK